MKKAKSFAADNPAAVLSVLFVRNAPSYQVLVGLRATETNPRHPGVVSTPTMRIPAAVARELCRTNMPQGEGSWNIDGPVHPFGVSGSGNSIEGLLVESILTKKIISGHLLESGEVSGTCSVSCISMGDVDDPTGRDGTTEPTLMVTITAVCSQGSKYLEGNSSSYSKITWVAPDQLIRSWREHDAQILFPNANPFEICIHGLCVRSAVHVLKDEAVD